MRISNWQGASFTPYETGVAPQSRFAQQPRTLLRISLQRPILTPAILAVLVAIFLLMTAIGGSLDATQNDQMLVQWGAKTNSLVFQGEWWRLITATFLHAGFLHILFNGYALYVIGMSLEAFIGRWRFAAIYFVSGLGGSVASFAFSPWYAVDNSAQQMGPIPGVGASGAIFGLIGALGVYFALYRKLFGKIGNIQFWNIVVVVVLNLGLGFSGILPVDNSAHLGGLAVGAALGYVLCPRYRLGEWINLTVRQLIDTNKGYLPWLAAALITLAVIMAFFLALLLFKAGILTPATITIG